jgi:hypothetical protein
LRFVGSVNIRGFVAVDEFVPLECRFGSLVSLREALSKDIVLWLSLIASTLDGNIAILNVFMISVASVVDSL